MNTLVVKILFMLINLSILVNLTTAAELGESACSYFGDFDPEDKRCHKDVLEMKYLPDTCTSFVYDGITCNENLDIVPNVDGQDLENICALVNKKPNGVFLYYKQQNMDGWCHALFKRDPSAEARKVKDFVDKYPIGGLILYGIEQVPEEGDFYQQFSTYVNAFKTEMPELKIGFYLRARDIIYYMNDTTGFDFDKMNCVTDFYIIEFDTSFNPCLDEFLHGGITPLISKNPNVNTLTNFAAALNASTIAKDKVYFELLISPTPKEEEFDSLSLCEISYSEYCENKNYDSTWCVDNQDTLYEKGEFAKQYANGFVAKFIDLVDRDLKCQCNDDKFITFNMLLNGFKGADKITCDRFEC